MSSMVRDVPINELSQKVNPSSEPLTRKKSSSKTKFRSSPYRETSSGARLRKKLSKTSKSKQSGDVDESLPNMSLVEGEIFRDGQP